MHRILGALAPDARRGATPLGGRGVLSKHQSVLKKGLRGAVAPEARVRQLGETANPAQAAVGAQGGPAGGSSSQGPGTSALGGRGVLPRRQSVLREAVRGAAVPKAPAHQPGGTGSAAQVVVGAQGGPAGCTCGSLGNVKLGLSWG